MRTPIGAEEAGRVAEGGVGERRRAERRVNARVADLTLPDFRRMLVTTTLFVIVLVLFLWMVRTVVIAAILGVVIAAYLRPVYDRVLRRVRRPAAAAFLTLVGVLLPLAALLAYSYVEVAQVARYLAGHQDEVTARVVAAVRRLPFLRGADVAGSVRAWVLAASDYGAKLPGVIKRTVVNFSVAATIFFFTAWYILTDADEVVAYVRGKVPPRYAELVGALEANVRGVLYGAVYATLVTQALKTAVIFLLNVFFHVPLAAVLAIAAFIVGFFPIVGSWSVYVPVALWLFVFRDDAAGALVMLAVGSLVNTFYISTVLRPKLAAERSRVLNFYWMLVGLVTGVYTFGLAGILLGPILIGLLKAIIDTVTAQTSWRSIEQEGEPGSPAAPGAVA